MKFEFLMEILEKCNFCKNLLNHPCSVCPVHTTVTFSDMRHYFFQSYELLSWSICEISCWSCKSAKKCCWAETQDRGTKPVLWQRGKFDLYIQSCKQTNVWQTNDAENNISQFSSCSQRTVAQTVVYFLHIFAHFLLELCLLGNCVNEQNNCKKIKQWSFFEICLEVDVGFFLVTFRACASGVVVLKGPFSLQTFQNMAKLRDHWASLKRNKRQPFHQKCCSKRFFGQEFTFPYVVEKFISARLPCLVHCGTKSWTESIHSVSIEENIQNPFCNWRPSGPLEWESPQGFSIVGPRIGGASLTPRKVSKSTKYAQRLQNTRFTELPQADPGGLGPLAPKAVFRQF